MAAEGKGAINSHLCQSMQFPAGQAIDLTGKIETKGVCVGGVSGRVGGR